MVITNNNTVEIIRALLTAGFKINVFIFLDFIFFDTLKVFR